MAIDAAGAVATWFGWLRPVDAPVTLLAATREAADAVARELYRIGVDDIVGAHCTELPAGDDRVTVTRRGDFEALAGACATGGSPLVIDVRESADWRQGHVAGALHVPVHDIEAEFDGLRPRVSPWLYCGVGIRAALAASLLERLGIDAVVVDDSVELAAAHGVPWCSGDTCTDLMCTAGIRAHEPAPA